MAGEFVGRTFGDFFLREAIGAGGSGEVYLAEQLTLGREAVIKVLSTGGDKSSTASERFLREARLASRLDHPFAAHVYAFGVESDATLWIAMELVRGSSLDKVVKQQGPVPLARFVPFFERLCEVLKAAHDQGIIHRDIKPANVMLLQRAGRWLPKLLDLGIARVATGDESETAATEERAHDTFDESLDANSTPPASDPLTLSGSLAGRLTRSESMHLTAVGSLVGTPHYMPPEQWADASMANEKSDIYSLAILAYKCLTGKEPFLGKNFKTLARAHASLPLPPLPPALPAELLPVLQRGAAKDPAARFASTVEFAEALRAASGLERAPPTLPDLDDGLRENILSEAPQPIAEAVALLSAASTPRAALEAAAAIATVIARYLGVIALAARARIGSGGQADPPALLELIARLKADRLDAAGWLHVCEFVLRPFATRRDAHVMPELIRVFFSEKGLEENTLKAMVSMPWPLKDAGDDEVLSFLRGYLPVLGSALERLSFLSDYPLIVQQQNPERWMGTRRPKRVLQASAAVVKRGEVVLLDAVGEIVVALGPLIQCTSPSGGAPDELFFIDGNGRHGARLVALPASFELQDETLWEWFVAQNLLAEGTGHSLANEAAPYKGLSTFTPDDADNYFGREREAEAFANRLRQQPFLAVVGPSGTGKSSFVLAGVLPLLPQGWRAISLRPGATPMQALKTRLEHDGLPSPEHGIEEFVRAIRDDTLVVVVDQFEELVTLCADPGARDVFASLLLDCARHDSGRVRVVLTLRDDFLIRVQQLPAFRHSLSNSLQLLGTPAPADLQRVVTEPARRVGYSFDDATLPKRMVEAVSEYSGALALLSFTAAQLWEMRDRHLRLMRVKTYDALGGVGGALAHHAETVLGEMADDEKPLVREAFRHLVTAQGTRAVLSRREALELLGSHALGRGVLDKLINARLLVSGEAADGQDTIEIIHEALTTAWPRLVDWQREDAEGARLRDSLRASARQWAERGKPTGLLWRKETLAEYRVWRARFPGRLTQLEEEFASASLRDEARGRTIRRGLAITAFVILAVGLAVVFQAYRRADASATAATLASAEASTRLQRLWEEQSRLASIARKPMEALVYAKAAAKAGASGPALEHLIASSAFQLQGALGIAATLEGSVARIKVSPDGNWVVALSSAEANVFSRRRPEQRKSLRKTCDDVEFSADSKLLIAVCIDLTMVVVDLTSNQESVFPTPNRFMYLGRRSNGRFIGSGGGDAVYEFDQRGVMSLLHRIRGTDPLATTLTAGDRVLIHASRRDVTDRTVRTITVIGADGHVEWVSPAGEPVTGGAVDQHSSVLAFARSDGTLEVVDLKKHKTLWSVPAHSGFVTDITFSSDAVLSIGFDGLLSARTALKGGVRFVRPVIQGALNRLVTCADDQMVFLAGSDGVVRKFDALLGSQIWEHHGHSGRVLSVACVEDEVLSGGADGSVWRWASKYPFNTQLGHSPLLFTQATRHQIVAGLKDEAIVFRSNGGLSAIQMPASQHGDSLYELDVTPRDGVLMVSDKGPALAHLSGDVWESRDAGIGSASLSDDEKTLASISSNRRVRVTDRQSGHIVWERDDVGITSDILIFGQRVFANSEAGDLLSWPLNRGDGLRKFHLYSHIFRLARTSRPDVFVTKDSNRRIVFWRDAETPEQLGQPLVPSSAIVSANLNAELNLAFLVLTSGTLQTWDLRRGKQLSVLDLGASTSTASVEPEQHFVITKGRGGSAQKVSISGEMPKDLDAFINCRVTAKLVDEEISNALPSVTNSACGSILQRGSSRASAL